MLIRCFCHSLLKFTSSRKNNFSNESSKIFKNTFGVVIQLCSSLLQGTGSNCWKRSTLYYYTANKKKIAIQNALLQVLIGCCKKLRTDNSKAPHIPFTFHKNKGNTCPKLWNITFCKFEGWFDLRTFTLAGILVKNWWGFC